MVKRGKDLPLTKNTNMRGGEGTILLHSLLEKEEFHGHGRLFSHITVNPGCSVGYHEHHGEMEVYVVLSGNGVFNDNGEEYPVSTGDVTITHSGEGHAMTCVGSQPLELIALILYTE
ncbi:MAG TPA: cupin domain-containing protein [Clostridiales bacterium]|jgi:mannose-6-phosphate isomerase-like protein (cupin superfamily)|nr:cupin domain-containing protein [Clostridiales bacterium]